jgi:hypothetical protein
VSCPCFSPSHPRTRDAGARSLLLPLGDSFAGVCLAHPGDPVDPEESCLPLCNLGYARGECPRFPADSSADAVRFALSRDDGESLQIYYVLERGHHPFQNGEFTYFPRQRTFSPELAAGPLSEQAAAYASSYLRRKHPSGPQPDAE